MSLAKGVRIAMSRDGNVYRGIVDQVVIRGNRWWVDLTDGQSIQITGDTRIETEAVVGTGDFLQTPEERWPNIYAAYDVYGTAPIRQRKICRCGRCVQPSAPSGMNAAGIPFDDVNPTSGGPGDLLGG